MSVAAVVAAEPVQTFVAVAAAVGSGVVKESSALVLDGARRVAHIADPNGALLPGGNIEFVALPFCPRARPTTALSRYDLDQRAAAAALKRGAKGGATRAKAQKGPHHLNKLK